MLCNVGDMDINVVVCYEGHTTHQSVSTQLMFLMIQLIH